MQHTQQRRYSLVALRFLLVLAAATIVQSGGSDDQCRDCDRLAAAFRRGLERTSRDNFGGGNTNWEETRLGVYALSETRLVDITERLCKDETAGSAAAACHAMLERVEDDIEKWWFGPFKAYPTEADIREYVCVNRTGFCCGHGRWGPDCAPCPGCSGHGDCNGNGTRAGTGACDCHSGYVGQQCGGCAEHHFRSVVGQSDAGGGECVACHQGCRSSCTGPLATQCDACADGYRLEGDGIGCVDIDECGGDACTGQQRKFCENTPGSFQCRDCDPACAACSGPSPAGCTACAAGYEPSATGSGCQDVNECSPDSPHCAGPHERCVNLPGSHRCDCQPGYQRQSGQCLPKPKPAAAKAGGKPGGAKKRGSADGKKAKPPKLIWTVAYTLEFAKFLAAIVGLGIFAVAVKGRPVPVVLAACAAGWYLCRQSLVLDRVYLQARG